jgi:hypothetical protein
VSRATGFIPSEPDQAATAGADGAGDRGVNGLVQRHVGDDISIWPRCSDPYRAPARFTSAFQSS